MKILEIFEIQNTPLFGMKPYNIPVIHKTKGRQLLLEGWSLWQRWLILENSFNIFQLPVNKLNLIFFYLCEK